MYRRFRGSCYPLIITTTTTIYPEGGGITQLRTSVHFRLHGVVLHKTIFTVIARYNREQSARHEESCCNEPEVQRSNRTRTPPPPPTKIVYLCQFQVVNIITLEFHAIT
jgi:hypothetical protein